MVYLWFSSEILLAARLAWSQAPRGSVLMRAPRPWDRGNWVRMFSVRAPLPPPKQRPPPRQAVRDRETRDHCSDSLERLIQLLESSMCFFFFLVLTCRLHNELVCVLLSSAQISHILPILCSMYNIHLHICKIKQDTPASSHIFPVRGSQTLAWSRWVNPQLLSSFWMSAGCFLSLPDT